MQTKKEILEELAKEFDDEYESLTSIHGAYGQMKVRAAYRLASVIIQRKADEEEN